jgi:hypothetical protein
MRNRERQDAALIDKFRLRGTLFEQLLQDPQGWADPNGLQDSPNLQRYAMDVRRAFVVEGWLPPTTTRPGRRI